MLTRDYILSVFAFPVLFFSITSSLTAKDGDLDPTFGGGTRLMAFSSSNDACYASAIQPDGKIVMAGRTGGNGPYEILVMRCDTDGSLDAGFGSDGTVTTSINGVNDQASSVTIQPDGKIVVAGQTDNAGNIDAVIVRYNTDGSLDTSFSGDGIVTTDFGTGANIANAVAIQTNGMIVIAGWNDVAGVKDFAVARYNANGSLDTSFSGDGMVTTDFGVGTDVGRAIVIQTDGRIVVGGSANNGANYDFGLARYNTNGSLDTSFSGDGMVTTPIGISEDDVFAVGIQTDGKIVAAGRTKDGSWYEMGLARYNTDGTLDTGFDGDGKLIISFAAKHDELRGLVIQPDGKIVGGGNTYYSTHWDLMAIRLNEDGSLDTSFSEDGIAYAPVLNDSHEYGYSVILQADGNIIVAGACVIEGVYDVAAARFKTDGSLDGTFWPGRAIATPGGDNSDLRAIAILADNRIVMSGRTFNANWDFALARYSTNGTLDTTFDGDGIVVTDIGGNHDYCYGAAVQTDGKILAGGCAYVVPNWNIAVVRYDTNGVLDTTFSGDGKVTTDVGGDHDYCYDIALQPDGKIVAVGQSLVGGKYDIVVLRYDSDGALDTGFSGDGMVLTDIGGNDDYGRAVSIQTDGKIVVAGFSDDGARADFAVLRYNSDGSLDTDFDGDGIATTSIGGIDARGYDMAIQPNGKIVVAGSTDVGGVEDFAAVRYNTDGTLDTGFDGDGIVTTDFGADDSCRAVAIQSAGRVVLVGHTADGSQTRFALVRYISNGELDGKFGVDGKTTAIVCDDNLAFASVELSNGNILICGRTYTGVDNVFAAACFLCSTPSRGTVFAVY